MTTATRAQPSQANPELWRADVALVLSRTLAVWMLPAQIAVLTPRLRDGLLLEAATGLTLYALLVVAAVSPRLLTGWRVAIVLAVLARIAFNIILSRGLGLNVGVLAVTFGLLTLLAWGRIASALAIGAWVVVFGGSARTIAENSGSTIPEHGAWQVLTSLTLWMALTAMAIVALSSVIARLEEGVRHANELEARLRAQAGERLALAHRLLSEEEGRRGNLARELHDDIGQRLTAIKITLETARVRRQDTLAAACRESVRLMQDLVRDMSHSTNLRPTLIDEQGLGVAIRTLVRDETLRAGLTGEVEIPDRLPLGDKAQMACYRIVQEALTNSIRHARARSITVRAEPALTGVAFVVRDDGVGFDAEAARQLGRTGERLGLLGMRERAEGIGADLEIVSAHGRGTEIRLVVPEGLA